jgi:hypothetical protein
MGLTDVTGVLSRYFIVGFYAPAFFALATLWLAASSGFQPNEFERHSEATQLAIVGALAFLLALALSGLNYAIIRLYEGYPLEKAKDRAVLGPAYRRLLSREQRRFDGLSAEAARPGEAGDRAAVRLDRFFPDLRDRLLPTRFGNAVRAFEDHPFKRWGLDGVPAWPRIEMLLSADERELHTDAKIELNVFVNLSVGAALVGVALLVDLATNQPVAWYWCWAYALPFAAAYALYLPTVGAAARWGSEVRSSFDLHRLELYEELGVRTPVSFSDERAVAGDVNVLLVYGNHLRDDLWRTSPEELPEASEVPGDVRTPRPRPQEAPPLVPHGPEPSYLDPHELESFVPLGEEAYQSDPNDMADPMIYDPISEESDIPGDVRTSRPHQPEPPAPAPAELPGDPRTPRPPEPEEPPLPVPEQDEG